MLIGKQSTPSGCLRYGNPPAFSLVRVQALLTDSRFQVDATLQANSGHPGAPMGELTKPLPLFLRVEANDTPRHGTCGPRTLQQVHDLQPTEPGLHQPRSLRSIVSTPLVSTLPYLPLQEMDHAGRAYASARKMKRRRSFRGVIGPPGYHTYHSIAISCLFVHQ